jgi:cold shock CspA family protein/ribosome-associated translation inhibitor RaiA
MQRPLQITSRDFALTPAIEAEIRTKVAALEQFYERISGCHVIVEGAVDHHHRGGPFKVRIDMTLPGAELSVNHQDEDDLAIAIRSAFDAARRKVQDYARKQRGDVKSAEAPPHARVSQLFELEGYGFLTTNDGREIYFHRNSVLNDAFDRLKIGTEVRFAEEMGDKGPQASSVAIAGKP